MDTIIHASPRRGLEDIWEWCLEGSKFYSSKSAYGWLQQNYQREVRRDEWDKILLKKILENKSTSRNFSLFLECFEKQNSHKE